MSENHRFKSMSSIKEAQLLASPQSPPANQLNNKFFVNQVQSNLSSSLENSNRTAALSDNVDVDDDGAVITSPATTSRPAAIETHKYFTSNVSLLTIENGTNSESTTLSPKSRFKMTTNPFGTANKNKTIQHHQHHGKTNGSASGGRTHFQIAQKQLSLSKNIRTEPPPMLNHILDSLSVSNSKHLHHDHRFVLSIICHVQIL